MVGVTKVDEKKGFGFLTTGPGTADVFVHHTAIKASGYRTLAENQSVTFDVEQSEKGQRAINVVPEGK